MNLENYIKIANNLKEVRTIFYEEMPSMIGGKRSGFSKHRDKAQKAIESLRNHLEEMMFIECGEDLFQFIKDTGNSQAAIEIFYGCDKRANYKDKKFEGGKMYCP